MATIQIRRGLDSAVAGVSGAAGEPLFTTDAKELWICDGGDGTGKTKIGPIPGADGADGADGTDGADGLDGATWTTGTGTPSGGADGDLYLDTATGDVYLRAGGSWSVVANITGPAGADGVDGADGLDAATWTTGSGVPSGGVDGDLYLRTSNGDVYQRAGGTWSVVANIKGPTGATGATGPTGATGATGPNTVSTSTSTPLVGYLKGNGSVVSAVSTIPVSDLTGSLSSNLGGVPTGTVLDFAGLTVPAGYLSCDGTAVSRSTYTALHSALVYNQLGDFTTGSSTVTGIADTSLIRVGAAIESAYLTAGTTVASIVSGTSITVSTNATTTGNTNGAIYNYGNGDAATTFNLPDLRRRVTVGMGGTGTATLASRLGATGGAETHTLSTTEMPSHNHAINLAATSGLAGGANFNLSTGAGANTTSTGGGGAHNNIQPSMVVQRIIKT